MKNLDAWYLSGAVVTLALGAVFGAIWSLPGVTAMVVGWGAFIGNDLREKRRRAAVTGKSDSDSVTRHSRLSSAIIALVVTCALLGVGLMLGILITRWQGRTDDVTVPLTVGIVLLASTAAAFLAAVVVLARRRRSAGVRLRS